MTKSCPIVSAEGIFLNAQRIELEDGSESESVYLNFLSSEYIPDYSLLLPAEEILNAAKDKNKVKSNLRFRVEELVARGYGLKRNGKYRVVYAYEVNSFNKKDSDQSIAYNRKWIQSIELVSAPEQ